MDNVERAAGELVGFGGVFEVEVTEAAVTELLVVLADELGFHEVSAVGELGGEAFALGFDDGDAVDGAVGLTVEDEEVRHVAPDVGPCLPVPLVAVYLEFGQGVVAIEIDFQFLPAEHGERLTEVVAFEPAVEPVGQVVVGLPTFGVRVRLFGHMDALRFEELDGGQGFRRQGRAGRPFIPCHDLADVSL